MKAIFPAPFSLENTQEAFKARALELFAFQYKYNAVYHEFCRLLKKTPQQVQTIEDIPFLPISFFKTHQVITQLPLEPAEAFAEIKPLGKSIDSLFYFWDCRAVSPTKNVSKRAPACLSSKLSVVPLSSTTSQA